MPESSNIEIAHHVHESGEHRHAPQHLVDMRAESVVLDRAFDRRAGEPDHRVGFVDRTVRLDPGIVLGDALAAAERGFPPVAAPGVNARQLDHGQPLVSHHSRMKMRTVLKQPPPIFFAPYPAARPRSSLLIVRQEEVWLERSAESVPARSSAEASDAIASR